MKTQNQKSKIKSQKEEVKAIENNQTNEEQNDYKDKYLRALADYQNLIKRTQQEKEEFFTYAHESLAGKLVPVLDHLERAEKHTGDAGVELVYKELHKVLEDLGLKRVIISENDAFNPEIMECIEAEQDGKRLVELQTGYMFKNKIIRPVQVKVVK